MRNFQRMARRIFVSRFHTSRNVISRRALLTCIRKYRPVIDIFVGASTLFVGVLTVIIIWRQADIADTQSKLTIAQQRPYVLFALSSADFATWARQDFSSLSGASLSFTLTNYGETPATIKSLQCAWIVISQTPQISLLDKNKLVAQVDPITIDNPAIVPGASHKLPVPCGTDAPNWPSPIGGTMESLDDKARAALRDPDLPTRNQRFVDAGFIWVIGRIRYEDVFGFPHETTWCVTPSYPDIMVKLPPGQLFRPAGGPDCNHRT